MKRSFLAFALAALLAAAPGADKALADVDCSTGWSNVPSGTCNSSKRISDTDSTCFSADKTQSGFTTTVTMTHECSDHGNLVLHIDRAAAKDRLGCISGDAEANYINTVVRSVKCCFEGEADLCWKEQVEKSDTGYIKRYSRSSGTLNWTKHKVSTHQERYNFCQTYPNDVYCKVNPNGDALIDPASVPAPTVQDCVDKFDDSHAATDSGCTDPIMTFTAPSSCKLVAAATCDSREYNTRAMNNPTVASPADDDYGIEFDVVDDDLDDVRYCGGFRYCAGTNSTGYRWALVDGTCPVSPYASDCP